MKRFTTILFVLLFLLLGKLGTGQNLVPNPSFEDTIACPTAADQVYNSSGWKNYSDQSPDYFNSCTSNGNIDVPYNWGGYQVPASGNAYCAVSAFFPNTPNKREIIGKNLSSSMVIGTKYYFSMKVALSINSTASSSYACDKLGARFSTYPYSSSNPVPINNFAHIWTDSIITDTVNWTTVFGSFIADSSYSHIAIGNFFDDSNTDTIKIVSGTPTFIFAYYYIDEVCVSTDSSFAANYTYTGIATDTKKDDISIYPNPVVDYFQIYYPFSEPYHLTIYNSIGQKLFEKKNIVTDRKAINTKSFNKGILFLKIRTKNQNFTYKLLKP